MITFGLGLWIASHVASAWVGSEIAILYGHKPLHGALVGLVFQSFGLAAIVYFERKAS